MKKKLISLLVALGIAVSFGLVAAPGAQAAATYNCRSWQDHAYTQGFVKSCSVQNGRSVQGYVSINDPRPRAVSVSYYSAGKVISVHHMWVYGSAHFPTITLPAGANFQIMVRDHMIKDYWSPTVSIP